MLFQGVSAVAPAELVIALHCSGSRRRAVARA